MVARNKHPLQVSSTRAQASIEREGLHRIYENPSEWKTPTQFFFVSLLLYISVWLLLLTRINAFLVAAERRDVQVRKDNVPITGFVLLLVSSELVDWSNSPILLLLHLHLLLIVSLQSPNN